MLKKIRNIVILFGILLCITNTVWATEYWEKENKKREKLVQTELKNFIETFMTEETPEEDRITSYELSGYGMAEGGETEDKLHVTISFRVTPVNENNTTWSTYNNNCFAVFSKVNGEYLLDRISRYPDHYDEFLRRFEEYKKQPKLFETTAIQGEERNHLANQEIEKINNNVIIVFAILFIISSIVLLLFIRKNHRNLKK